MVSLISPIIDAFSSRLIDYTRGMVSLISPILFFFYETSPDFENSSRRQIRRCLGNTLLLLSSRRISNRLRNRRASLKSDQWLAIPGCTESPKSEEKIRTVHTGKISDLRVGCFFQAFSHQLKTVGDGLRKLKEASTRFASPRSSHPHLNHGWHQTNQPLFLRGWPNTTMGGNVRTV